jgi:hypothetical protein
MNDKELQDVLSCSAGTFATITGLSLNDDVATFTRWITNNQEKLPYKHSALVTVGFCYDAYADEQKRKMKVPAGNLVIVRREYFMSVARFAKSKGLWEQLRDYIRNYCQTAKLSLYPDYYENCFEARMEFGGRTNCKGEPMAMFGGLVYHGTTGTEQNGSVSIDPEAGWRLHT